METLKKYYATILLVFSSIATLAFFFFRIFSAKSSQSLSQPLAEKLIADKKAELTEEKQNLEQSQVEVEKREFSDEEIERKFNK